MRRLLTNGRVTIFPVPQQGFAFGAIEASSRFGRKWKANAGRLGILDTSNVTVLADGAKWIWEEQLNNLREASGVLDVFHAVEHIAETSRAVFGAETNEASIWLEEGRMILIRDGWPGISACIDETHKPLRSTAKRKSLTSLKSYLGSHIDHLNDAGRLASGESIGSGQVEGACKNMIGRRIKQTGARWAVPRVKRMVDLCANLYWNATLTT